MRVVYVAGPYRAKTEWGVMCNIHAAERLALEVWRAGAVALCPHKNTALFGGAADDSVWLAGDLELLRRSDAVILTDDWTESTGAIDEVLFAIEHNIPVFTYFVNLVYWLEENEGIREVQSETQVKALRARKTRRAQAGPGT